MYLVFARENYWEVRAGEECYRTTAKDAQGALREAYDAQVLPQARRDAESARVQWEQAAAAVRAGVQRSDESHKEGSLRDRRVVTVTTLTFAHGRVRRCSPQEVLSTIDSEIVRVAGATPKAPDSRSRPAWISESGATAHQVRGWNAFAYDKTGAAHRLELDLSDWALGAPIGAITVALNQYASEGWELISANEDKGLYVGADAVNEAYPARLRLLLGR